MPFTHLGLDAALLRATKELGYNRPTPIQDQAIPPALAGKDLLACAMTGSGKTAAFLLPIVQGLLGKSRGVTRALILTPTRELAAQITQSLDELATHTPITGASVFGGVGMGPQEHAFRSGVDIIVATPGRLLDHMKQPYVKFDRLEYLVLDEADRMLDMGFLPDIRRILRAVPAKRQTLFFSATMPDPIVKLSREMLQSPVMIDLERKSTPAIGITQAVYPVKEDAKAYLLVELIRRGEVKDAIVFTRTKHRTNRLSDLLTKQGVPNARMHGNRSQSQRTDALAGFKSGEIKVLVATDIVARGIDVEALSHVVNFDVPHMPEDYVHRVGRTARAGLEGEAFTFCAPDEEADLRAIEKAVGKRLPRVTLPGFDYDMRPAERFEIPVAERIAEIRKRKAEERARAKVKAERKLANQGAQGGGRGGEGARSSGPSRSSARPGERPAAASSGGPARPPRPASSGGAYRDDARPSAGGGGVGRRRGGRGRSGGGRSGGAGGASR
jgi:ATP-dependent RNA helicase RhlE